MEKIETEFKFIVEKPNIDTMRNEHGFSESEITQIYLNDSNRTHRVRKRVYSDGRVEYTENTKLRISGLSSIENEREIDENEFLALAKAIENGAKPLRKTRRTLEFLGKIFEFDFYEEWQSTCIMEVELESESEKFEFPPFVKIIKNVTGERKYSNHSMAHNFPEES